MLVEILRKASGCIRVRKPPQVREKVGPDDRCSSLRKAD